MLDKKKIGVLINSGPEYKLFLSSDFLQQYNDSELYFFVKKNDNINLIIHDLKDYKVVILEDHFFKFPGRLKMFFYNKMFRKLGDVSEILRNEFGGGSFHFLKGNTTKERFFVEKNGKNKYQEKYLKLVKLILFFFSDFFYSKLLKQKLSEYDLHEFHIAYGNNKNLFSVAQTVNSLGVFLCSHIYSWKDAYGLSFFPFYPNKISVWNDFIKEQLILMNPHLDKNVFLYESNVYLKGLSEINIDQAKKYIFSKYNLKKGDRKILLWCDSMNSFFSSETELKSNFKNVLEQIPIHKRPIVLVRQNPLNDPGIGLELIDDLTFFKTDNFWKISRDVNFCFQTISGEKEWMFLLKSVDVVITAPSSVLLEVISAQKPIFNILFNSDETKNSVLVNYVKNEFYQKLSSYQLCFFADGYADLINQIEDLKTDQIGFIEPLTEFIGL